MPAEAFIYNSIHIPIEKKKNGALNEVTPIDLLAKLMSHLKNKHPRNENSIKVAISKYGPTLCVAGGMGIATIIERV